MDDLLITDALKASVDVAAYNLPGLVRGEVFNSSTERSTLNFLWLFTDIVTGFSDVLVTFIIITVGQFRSIR